MPLEKKVISEKQYKNTVEKTIRFYKTGPKATLTTKEFMAIYNNLEQQFKKLDKKPKFIVRGMTNTNLFTFKSINDDTMNMDYYEEYLRGRVANPGKLSDAFQYFEVTVAMDI